MTDCRAQPEATARQEGGGRGCLPVKQLRLRFSFSVSVFVLVHLLLLYKRRESMLHKGLTLPEQKYIYTR